ncbi:hypothetical protein ANO11243_017030 [Dothideomycetidae sp. 11243]|nr:hypothetical protein ANO11243_017030 [fungal sp. No.11243]
MRPVLYNARGLALFYGGRVGRVVLHVCVSVVHFICADGLLSSEVVVASSLVSSSWTLVFAADLGVVFVRFVLGFGFATLELGGARCLTRGGVDRFWTGGGGVGFAHCVVSFERVLAAARARRESHSLFASGVSTVVRWAVAGLFHCIMVTGLGGSCGNEVLGEADEEQVAEL